MKKNEDLEIVALIPAYNEVGRIAPTLKALKQMKYITDIVVINDGSTDGTEKVVNEAEVRMISFPQNLGKGESLNRVLPGLHFDILLLVDADLGFSVIEAEKLIKTVINEDVDMAIAQFPPPNRKGGFGLVKGLARWGIRRFTGEYMISPLSGQRAIRKEVVNKIERLENGFGLEVALTIDVKRNGFKVIEVPCKLTHNETGRNLRDFLHRGKQFKDVLIALFRRW